MHRPLFRAAAFALAGAFALGGCTGDTGPQGPQGPTGPTGPTGPGLPVPPGAGLEIEILSATVPATGDPTVHFRITDAQDDPIDLPAELAAGAFGGGPRWTLAARDATTGVYTNLYEASVAGKSFVDPATGTTTAPALASATQAVRASVSNTSYATVATGEYVVTFATPAGSTYTPAAPDLVHTVGVWATRTFDGVAYPRSTSYHFVPSTGAVAAARNVVVDSACNKCHQNLQAHDTRRTVGLCLTCHSPQTTDPESGNTVDFRVMVHRIHSGISGYEIVGFAPGNPATLPASAVHDFGKVVFPPSNSVKDCSNCHAGTGGDADNWKTKPSRAACGSCHTGVPGLPADLDATAHLAGFSDDTACAGCHGPAGIRPIETMHSALRTASNDQLFVGRTLQVAIDSVTNVAPSTAPTITFTVSVDGAPVTDFAAGVGADVSVGFVVAGPTTDYSGVGAPDPAGYFTPTVTLRGATPNVAPTATPGQWTYTSTVALPADAAGSIGVVPTGSVNETIGANTRTVTLDAPTVFYAAVGGGTVQARRQIADNAKCNACHSDLSFHGNSGRKTPDVCAMCHNPSNVNDERTSRFEVDPVSGLPFTKTPESVQLSSMIHKIHAGGELSHAFVLGTDRSLTVDPLADSTTFSNEFVGDLGNCQTCHRPGTYGLPGATVLATLSQTFTCVEDPAADADTVCNDPVLPYPAGFSIASSFIPPQKSVCTSCHDSDATKAHADLNTLGVYPTEVETCAVCHGPGRTYDVFEVHRPRQ